MKQNIEGNRKELADKEPRRKQQSNINGSSESAISIIMWQCVMILEFGSLFMDVLDWP
jgi:hypothetical protein